MIIIEEQIRNHLKQFDSFLGHKPSKTKALLDSEYDVIKSENLLVLCGNATQGVADFFRQKDPVVYADLTKYTLYQLYEEESSDCEDITYWSISLFQMLWKLSGNNRNPALFRVIVKNEYGLHSIGYANTDRGWRFIEFQNLTLLQNQKILAVT